MYEACSRLVPLPQTPHFYMVKLGVIRDIYIIVCAFSLKHMSRVVRKPAFCIRENKDADQLRGNREATQTVYGNIYLQKRPGLLPSPKHPIKLGVIRDIYINVCAFSLKHMSRVVRRPAFCIRENKDADQLCGNREADQRLCFHYIDSTIPLLSKSDISIL